MSQDPYFKSCMIFLGLAALAAGIAYYVYPHSILAVLIGLNIGSFALFAFDKAAAGRNRSRVPELVLLLSALLGGALGALCGVKLLRHKSSKYSFQIKLLLVLALQIAAWVLWKENFSKFF